MSELLGTIFLVVDLGRAGEQEVSWGVGEDIKAGHFPYKPISLQTDWARTLRRAMVPTN